MFLPLDDMCGWAENMITLKWDNLIWSHNKYIHKLFLFINNRKEPFYTTQICNIIILF